MTTPARTIKPTICILFLLFSIVEPTSSTRILDEEQPPAFSQGATNMPPQPAGTGGTSSSASGTTNTDHTMTFFVHDILGGSNPSARAITGIVNNQAVSGQIPFAKPYGAVLPTNNNGGVPANNYNNIPLLTGLNGVTSQVFQNNGNHGVGFPRQLPVTSALQNLMFGTVTVIDDEVTERPEIQSNTIGKAQGFYVFSSVHGDSQTMMFTVMFETNNYVDSLCFLGVHMVAVSESQLAVIGGTGKYANAKGFATVTTLPPSSGDQHQTDGVETILKLDVYLS